ncbi:MAG: hypothetical protein ORN24_00555 [Burkholderiales bacterium]|nr:hypothetical protein [Burkholderiales bacterium]
MLKVFLKYSCWLLLLGLTNHLILAQDMIGISEVDSMLMTGKNIVEVAAKWGGIITVVGSALALGSGRLEGALAQTICKIFIVIGLLIAAFTFFGTKVSWGFNF